MRCSSLLVSLACIAHVLTPPLSAGPGDEAQKLIKRLASHRDTRERAEAAWELGQIGATEAVPALVTALEDRAPSVRANAAASLWELGDVSEPAMPALEKALLDPYGLVVSNAAGALAMLGFSPVKLAPAYRRLLSEEDCGLRVRGLHGLQGQAPPAELFPHALDCSRNGEIDHQLAAGDVLRRLMDNRSMVPVILDALRKSGDADVKDLLLGISTFEPPVEEAVPVVERFLGFSDAETRDTAARSLGRMKETAVAALPSLIELLGSDPDARARATAAEAIGNMGESAAAAVPALVEAAREDEWPKVREASLQSLGRMGEAAKAAIPVLYEALEDADRSIRVTARNALFRLDPENKAAVADLADAPPRTASAAAASGKLFEDITGLPEVLAREVPEANELLIYTDFAMVTAPEPTSRGGYGQYTYRQGALSGPKEGQAHCKDTFRFTDVDLSLVPRLVKESLQRAGGSGATVVVVSLTRGVFCKKVGWIAVIQNGARASRIEFKLDGKLKKVWP